VLSINSATVDQKPNTCMILSSVKKTLDAARFLFIGPMILVMLFVINLMTSPGHWWVQWAALGIGIAWVACLLRVLKVLLVLGGLGALIAYLRKK
jgi:hypothetical protein